MRSDSSLAQKKTISAQDIATLPLIISQQSLLNHELAEWYGHSLEEANIVATYNLVFNASFLVLSSFGYAITLDQLVSTKNQDLCFCSFYLRLEAPLNLVWKRNRIFSKPANLFFKN